MCPKKISIASLLPFYPANCANPVSLPSTRASFPQNRITWIKSAIPKYQFETRHYVNPAWWSVWSRYARQKFDFCCYAAACVRSRSANGKRRCTWIYARSLKELDVDRTPFYIIRYYIAIIYTERTLKFCWSIYNNNLATDLKIILFGPSK